MLRKGLIVLLAALLVTGAAYALALYNNSRPAAFPDRRALEARHERAIQWLVDHRESILDQNNVLLWWTLYENEQVMPDARVGRSARSVPGSLSVCAKRPVGSGRYLGFGPRGLSVNDPRSTFHMTAQGVYLLSLLLTDQDR